MNSQDISNMMSYRLRRLSQSGLPAEELAKQMHALLLADRSQKLPIAEAPIEMSLPFFARRRTHLNVV
ncbi:MAG: hypothetical protein K2X27_08195 [Candidatus Obscuribacterales bacterium]|nr:hypothetical protein [Candidatus Obscuribacterales bacterium]